MKSKSVRVFTYASFSVLALVSECKILNAQPQISVKLEDIIQASRMRQEKSKKLYINLTQRITDAKGSRSVPKEVRLKGQGETIPPRDITYDSHTQLWIDGQKIRYAFDNYQWSEQEQNFVPLPEISTFDGKLLKILSTITGTDKPHPSGSIEKQQKHFVVASVYLLPLFLTFRALDPTMREFDINQITLTGRRAQIGGHLCCELQFQEPTSSVIIHLWVDPSRDFVIPRYVKTVDGKLDCQLDVQFSRDNQVGWVPREWNCISQFIKDGRLRHSVKSKVNDIQINPSIPKDTFDIIYPHGTFMRDFENGEHFYIIKENGDKRPVQGSELSLPYQQLVAPQPRRWWSIAIILGGLLLAVACYAWKKRVKRRPEDSATAG